MHSGRNHSSTCLFTLFLLHLLNLSLPLVASTLNLFSLSLYTSLLSLLPTPPPSPIQSLPPSGYFYSNYSSIFFSLYLPPSSPYYQFNLLHLLNLSLPLVTSTLNLFSLYLPPTSLLSLLPIPPPSPTQSLPPSGYFYSNYSSIFFSLYLPPLLITSLHQCWNVCCTTRCHLLQGAFQTTFQDKGKLRRRIWSRTAQDQMG